MSKYDVLWSEVGKHSEKEITLSYEFIEEVLGFTIDHSFLTFKKELLQYGYQVGKISMKDKWVRFERID